MYDLVVNSEEILRFAEEVDAIASRVASIDVSGLSTAAEQAAPGAGISESVAKVERATTELLTQLSKDLGTYSNNVRSFEADFSSHETEVASKFNQMKSFL
ncbi:MAG: hypothetical protein CSA82_00525 [Actinobacteria bacterium]|nr:MAG: hypothetical protein CSA82_00525 [Actinomycetota bacterium]